MVLSAPAVAVLDLDGTLVRTEARNALVRRRSPARSGVPLTPERLAVLDDLTQVDRLVWSLRARTA